MTTTAELNKEQVDSLDLTISITMSVKDWNIVRAHLISSNEPDYNGSKNHLIRAIDQTIFAMTGKLRAEYPPIPPQK